MSYFFPTDNNPSLNKEIQPIYCPHRFSLLTLICYHQTDENDKRHPLLSINNDPLFIHDALATSNMIDLTELIESYERHNRVVIISFNARMLKYIDFMAKIKPLGIKILCANEGISTEKTPHLIVNGNDMEFYYSEITPSCFGFDGAIKEFKNKYSEASVIEFSALAIRQLIALGKHISEASDEKNPF